MRRLLCGSLATALVASLCATVGLAEGVIPQNVAARYGLTRAWYTQIGSPRATGAISNVNYDRGTLFVQSKTGMISALDAETGRMLWSTQVGPENHTSTEPSANENFIVVVNGSVLYVLDRADGRLQWQKPLDGCPGAGPGASQTHAFVPMVNGQVEGYDLEKGANQTPWIYKSAGRVLVPPMTTNQSVSWTTEKGYFYVADPAGLGIRYRLETRDAIHSRPAYWTPHLYACSSDGCVYAVHEKNGKIVWKFAVGDPIYSSPVAIEGKVYAISVLSGMICLDGTTGAQLWTAPKIIQFVATSPTRIYACDQLGRLAILDAHSGTRLGAMPLDGISLKLINAQSDRLFLAADSCVMQCVREIDLKSPVIYTMPPPTKNEAKVPAKAPAAKPKADAAAEPADDADKPEADADDNAGPFK
jgi:outer membrane protein assembly factor BamB